MILGSRLHGLSRVLSLACLASLSAACSSEGDDGGDGGPGPTPSNAIQMADANQYSSTATLRIPSVEVAPTDITIDWSDVTQDLQCHDVDPESDLVNVSFLRFQNKTEEEIATELTKSRLEAKKIDKFWDYPITGGELQTNLGSFSRLSGTAIDVETDFTIDETRTYLVIVQVSTGLGVGTKSLAFAHPVEGGSDVLELGSGCPDPEILTFVPDLDKPKFELPAEGPWVVGWKDLTVDGTGGEIALTGIDKLLVGFYPDMTVSDLEVQQTFFDIEELADPMYELAVDGPDRKADLGKAKLRGGSATDLFPGFEQEGEGTWLLALTCSSCPNPQPVVLVIIDPSGD